MLRIFKTSADMTLEKLDEIKKNTWIDLVDPTENEIKKVVETTQIPANLIIKLTDSDETARIEKEQDASLIVVDVPFVEDRKQKNKYTTLPLGIICYKDYIVTISVKETDVVTDIIEGRVKWIDTTKRSRLLIQILHRISSLYIRDLKIINEEIEDREKTLMKATKNKDLIHLMNLQKSLVYFLTSLKSNEIILEKLEKGTLIKNFDENIELLEDAIIENKQGIETAMIYREIVSSMSETFTGIISNNLNQVMKFLAGITIVFSIPNMFASFFGMNVPLGIFGTYEYSFLFVISSSFVCALILAYLLRKKDML